MQELIADQRGYGASDRRECVMFYFLDGGQHQIRQTPSAWDHKSIVVKQPAIRLQQMIAADAGLDQFVWARQQVVRIRGSNRIMPRDSVAQR